MFRYFALRLRQFFFGSRQLAEHVNCADEHDDNHNDDVGNYYDDNDYCYHHNDDYHYDHAGHDESGSCAAGSSERHRRAGQEFHL